MTPPGFVTANGTTSRCADGSYRDGWAPAEAAGACVSCGQGMFGSNNEQIDLYDPVTEAISLLPVATDSTGCCECRGTRARARACLSPGAQPTTLVLTLAPTLRRPPVLRHRHQGRHGPVP